MRRRPTSACSSTPSHAPASRRGSSAARAAPIQPAAPSSRCSPAPTRACRRAASPSICRSARCRSSGGVWHQLARSFQGLSPQISTDDAVLATLPPDAQPEDPAPIDEAPPASERDPDDRVVAGTLRAPWRWEELLVEAYVIEGLDRWQRRLPGLRAEYERRLKELADEDQDSPRLLALARDRDELRHLESFALPIVAELDSWDSARSWGAWLTAFEALVPRVLRQPARVLRVLAEMAPLGQRRAGDPARGARGAGASAC